MLHWFKMTGKGGFRVDPITCALLTWYDRCARVLPWRGIHDPYRTWVSEAMLQQTRVETVLSYYDRFLARFPDLPSLAAADEADVLKCWEGLGYYSRARNLLAGARQVMEEYGGQLPSDPAELRKIRGVGPYMAGAIASIAFSVPIPAVDGNVIRVISRLRDIREDVTSPAVRKRIEADAAALVSAGRPGDHNQAMMDLGATVCVPGTPDCARCPLSGFCAARKAGNPADLPVLPKAKKQKVIPWTVLILYSGGNVLLRKRTEKLLQGLWCFPMLEGILSPEEAADAVLKKMWLACSGAKDSGNARHVFTHQVWEMNLVSLSAGEDVPAPEGYDWIPLSVLRDLALPSAMNAAVRAAHAGRAD